MWKDGMKCAVALGFDIDAETLWLGSFKQDTPAHLARGSYGPNVGMPRIMDLLDRYGVKASFFIPGWTAEHYPKVVEEIHRKNHEIGHHGYLHENVSRRTKDVEEEILQKGIEILKGFTGVKPVGYRSPAGGYSAHTLQFLTDYGFLYDSSLVGKDEPYYLAVEGREKKLLELPFSWELDDAPHFLFSFVPYHTGMAAPSKVLEIWRDEFDWCYREGGYYNLVCHPQIIGRRHRMKMLEDLIRHIRGHADVWFATHREIAEYWLEHHPA